MQAKGCIPTRTFETRRGLEMPDYRVEGMSIISWSLLVQASSESEASECAVRIAGGLSHLRQDHALRDARHEIVGCRRLIETPALERVPHRSAARRGDE